MQCAADLRSDFAGAIYNRQFVGEAFFLPDRDHSPIIFFLCSVQQLDRLPVCNVPLISDLTWPVLYTIVSSLEKRSFSLTVITPRSSSSSVLSNNLTACQNAMCR